MHTTLEKSGYLRFLLHNFPFCVIMLQVISKQKQIKITQILYLSFVTNEVCGVWCTFIRPRWSSVLIIEIDHDVPWRSWNCYLSQHKCSRPQLYERCVETPNPLAHSTYVILYGWSFSIVPPFDLTPSTTVRPHRWLGNDGWWRDIYWCHSW